MIVLFGKQKTSGVMSSGLQRIYLSNPDLMHNVLLHVSPWECSPYRLRRVCKSFKAFYNGHVMWIRLFRGHLCGTFHSDMPAKQVRHHCNLALRGGGGWHNLLQRPVLDGFRDSGWTKLNLSRSSVAALPPLGDSEEEPPLQSLGELHLQFCRHLTVLPDGIHRHYFRLLYRTHTTVLNTIFLA